MCKWGDSLLHAGIALVVEYQVQELCPERAYAAFIRQGGHLGWRIQLTGTPPPTGIEIHMGIWPRNSTGCILVGMSIAAGQLLNSTMAVERLRDAYQQHRGRIGW